MECVFYDLTGLCRVLCVCLCAYVYDSCVPLTVAEAALSASATSSDVIVAVFWFSHVSVCEKLVSDLLCLGFGVCFSLCSMDRLVEDW